MATKKQRGSATTSTRAFLQKTFLQSKPGARNIVIRGSGPRAQTSHSWSGDNATVTDSVWHGLLSSWESEKLGALPSGRGGPGGLPGGSDPCAVRKNTELTGQTANMMNERECSRAPGTGGKDRWWRARGWGVPAAGRDAEHQLAGVTLCHTAEGTANPKP